MENQNQDDVFCTKMVFQAPDDIEPTIILGKVLEEDNNFLVLKSGRGRIYKISKRLILNIESTNIPFREEV
jgi:hypothetical protein